MTDFNVPRFEEYICKYLLHFRLIKNGSIQWEKMPTHHHVLADDVFLFGRDHRRLYNQLDGSCRGQLSHA
ncbi:hypothetical protein ACI65C_008979 [Semiaphis heraclei]